MRAAKITHKCWKIGFSTEGVVIVYSKRRGREMRGEGGCGEQK